MEKKKILITLAIVLIVILLAGGIYLFEASRKSDASPQTATSDSTQSSVEQDTSPEQSVDSSDKGSVSTAQLEAANGKNGNPCYVAVSGTVYEISGIAEWVNGVHTSSVGKATCGRDLTDVLDESPHGSRVLSMLKIVGTYTP